MKRWLSIAMLACTVGLVSTALGEPPINTNGTAYALGGYDVVAYFSDGRPAQGDPKYRSVFAGATWLFASADHRASFDRAPSKYLPAYRGYCAYGVSRGSLVRIAPAAFSILRGRLYLNYSLEIRATWLERPDAYIRAADANWPKL